MGYVFNKPYSASSTSNSCIGRVDENGYIFNDPFSTHTTSTHCIGRVDSEGYIFDDPYATNQTSSHCVGRIDRDGHIFNHPFTTQTTSNRCVGRVDQSGYVFNDPFTSNTTSNRCIGKVDDYNIYHSGAAAYLLLLRNNIHSKAESEPVRQRPAPAPNPTPAPSTEPSAGGIIGMILGGAVLVAVGMFISWLGIDFFPFFGYIGLLSSAGCLVASLFGSRYVYFEFKEILSMIVLAFFVYLVCMVGETFILGIVLRCYFEEAMVEVSSGMISLSVILCMITSNSEDYNEYEVPFFPIVLVATIITVVLKIKGFDFINDMAIFITTPVKYMFNPVIYIIFEFLNKII